MSQALQIAKQSLIDLEKQKMDLERAHDAKKREIIAASQGVTGNVLFKALQDMSTAIVTFDRDNQTLNGKISDARANVERIQRQNQ